MQQNLEALKNRLKQLDDEIDEVKKRMPAHSNKPPLMMELFELEDERDALEKQIHQLKKKTEE
jgi:septum formation inhibitor MinC